MKIDKDDIDQVKKTLADECEVLKKRIAEGDLTPITVQLLYNEATRQHKYTFNLALTSQDFGDIIKPMLRGSKNFIEQTIREAEIETEKVSQVFLVGGTTMIAFFKLEVHSIVPNAKFYYNDKQADKCVAYGAACSCVINKKNFPPIENAWLNMQQPSKQKPLSS